MKKEKTGKTLLNYIKMKTLNLTPMAKGEEKVGLNIISLWY